jgi:hypothetical protein
LYRDGLLIALAALVALRRRTAARLVFGENVLHQGGQWRFAVAAVDTKTGARIDGYLPPWLNERLTRFVDHYRPHLTGAKVSSAITSDELFGASLVGLAVRPLPLPPRRPWPRGSDLRPLSTCWQPLRANVAHTRTPRGAL